MLIQNVVKKFVSNRMVRLPLKNAVDLLQDCDVLQRGLAEQNFAPLDVSIGERSPLRRELHIALLQPGEAEQNASLEDRQQVFDVHHQLFAEAKEVLVSTAIVKQLEQAGDSAHACVRQNLVLVRPDRRLRPLQSARRHDDLSRTLRIRQSVFDIRLGHHFVDVIHQFNKTAGLAVARMRELHVKIRADASRISSQDHDSVRQYYGLLDVVRDDEDCAGRHLPVEPELQQFAAQVFRRQHIESGKWFVHEQHFRFNHERPREPHPLFHPSGKLLGIRRLESVEAHSIQSTQRAFASLHSWHSPRFQRGLHILEYSEPGKQCEALKDDGHVGCLTVQGLAVPEQRARRRLRKAAQNPQQSRLAAAGGAQQSNDFPRLY